MPKEVIDRVNQLGRAQGQPELLTFYDRKGRLIGDDAELDDPIEGVIEDDAADAADEAAPTDDAAPDAAPTVNIQPNDPLIVDPNPIIDPNPDPNDVPDQDPDYVPDDDHSIVDADEYPNEILDPNEPPDPDIPIVETVDEDRIDPAPGVIPAPPQQGDPIAPRRSSRTTGKPSKIVPSFIGKSYYETAATTVAGKDGIQIELQAPTAGEPPDFTLVAHTIMTQLSMKTGLKTWGDRATSAVSKELSQLHYRDSFEPLDPKQLSKEDLSNALESHLFLKQKRDESIKGRMVAGGNKQRGMIPKEQASSPTVSLEAVLLTAVIDAAEGRDVATIDIPNAFVQTRLENEEDKAIMRLRGKLAELMVKVAPEIYSKYVIINSNGETMLYVRLLNALYGIMKAALLYYEKFVRDILSIGFVLNPYDPCVANKVVKGKQLTITWHVDDLKVSHVRAHVVTRMAKWLKTQYEKLFEDGSGAMTIHRGKIHDYLGMVLDYSTPGEVKVGMISYVKEMVQQFEKHDNSGRVATTPAAEHLFQVDDDATPLSEEKATIFHHFVAKSLFATRRARPDVSTAVAFLTTRVKGPDEDDWKKLVRMMRYLRGSMELLVTLSAESTSVLKWWVDGSHATHPNFRGHSGGCLSMGKGMPITGSSKQKLNTRSSTETELVAADDFMPMIIWTNLFLEAQGYGTKETILYQDNQSAILLEKNGRKSSGKRTKHLNIRYYFITDRISRKELSVAYCPTEEMVGDFFTKPLQGKLFYKFRSIIMNLKE
jgi:hypothetical protein